MRHVNRGAVPPLLRSLNEVDADRKWDSSGEQEVHAAIHEGLRHSQHRLCAYCERLVSAQGRVEHVHPKSCASCAAGPNPSNWHYHWDNLLLVCGSDGHCDGPKADNDLCDQVLFPDSMIPGQRYFEVDSLTGELTVLEGLGWEVSQRARSSIEAFALNEPALMAARIVVMETLLAQIGESGEAMARHRIASTLGFSTTVDSYFS